MYSFCETLLLYFAMKEIVKNSDFDKKYIIFTLKAHICING